MSIYLAICTYVHTYKLQQDTTVVFSRLQTILIQFQLQVPTTKCSSSLKHCFIYSFLITRYTCAGFSVLDFFSAPIIVF